MAARGLFYSGLHLSKLVEVRRRALHEYRDEMTRKLRRYREIAASEGWLHRAVRLQPLDRLSLSPGARETLASWRAPVTVAGMDDSAPVADPTDRDREPALRRFEELGEPAEGA